MIIVEYDPKFKSILEKLKDTAMKERIKKQIIKIVDNPEVGKPMRYARHGTREVHVGSFRLSYAFLKSEGKILFLDLYHKDEQ